MTTYSRRNAIGTIAAMSLPTALFPVPTVAQTAADPLMKVIRDVEARLQSRLGVSIRDIENGRTWTHRADERFPMCSTFKALAAAAVLARVDRGEDRLDPRVVFPAGNLMLKSIGGPEGLTRFLRGVGDTVSRLDRWETELNEATPGDPRDTTTPNALSATIDKLVLGSALSAGSRDQLAAWLVGNKVGDTKVRAGLPKDWKVGDKTGAGGFGTNNDTGIIWPPGRRPIVFTILTTETKASVEDKNAGMAEIARALRSAIAA